MRILCLIDSLAAGGMQKHMRVLQGELRRRGHSFDLASLQEMGLLWDEMADSEDVGLTNSSVGECIDGLIQLVKNGGYDVILNTGCSAVSSITSLTDTPIVEFWWGDLYPGMFCWGKANAIITCSVRSCESFNRLFPTIQYLVHIVDNPVLHESFPTAQTVIEWRKRNNIPIDSFLIVSLARFSRVKRHLRLVHEIAPFLRDNSDALLLIAGSTGKDGADWESTFAECREFVNQLGLSEQIRLVDFQISSETVLAASDVVVNMSESEGQSMTISEAMWLGKPVISTAVSGTDRQFPDCEKITGRLIPIYGPSNIAHHLQDLFHDRQLRLEYGENGRQLSLSRFSLKLHTDRVESILATVISSEAIVNPVFRHDRPSIVLLIITYGSISKVSPRVRAHYIKRCLSPFSVHVVLRTLEQVTLRDIANADVVVFHRVVQSLLFAISQQAKSSIWKKIQFLWESSLRFKPTGYDLDDYVFFEDSIPMGICSENLHLLRTATFVIGNSAESCRRFRDYSDNVFCIENPVDEQLWNSRIFPRYSRVPTIAWVAGTTHEVDADHAHSILQNVLKANSKVRVAVLGGLHTDSLLGWGTRVSILDPVRWYNVPAFIRQCDVSIAPLVDTPENQSKGHGHICEPALFGIPSVVQDTSSYREVVRHGENGLLATGTSDWVDKMLFLLNEDEKRLEIGKTIHEDVLARFSFPAIGLAYRKMLDKVLDASE